jgi:hypothetical protein
MEKKIKYIGTLIIAAAQKTAALVFSIGGRKGRCSLIVSAMGRVNVYIANVMVK